MSTQDIHRHELTLVIKKKELSPLLEPGLCARFSLSVLLHPFTGPVYDGVLAGIHEPHGDADAEYSEKHGYHDESQDGESHRKGGVPHDCQIVLELRGYILQNVK